MLQTKTDSLCLNLLEDLVFVSRSNLKSYFECGILSLYGSDVSVCFHGLSNYQKSCISTFYLRKYSFILSLSLLTNQTHLEIFKITSQHHK